MLSPSAAWSSVMQNHFSIARVIHPSNFASRLVCQVVSHAAVQSKNLVLSYHETAFVKIVRNTA